MKNTHLTSTKEGGSSEIIPPGRETAVVQDAIQSISSDLGLEQVISDLDLAADIVYLMYNSVSGTKAAIFFSDVQRQLEDVGFDFSFALVKNKNVSGEILKDIVAAIGYLSKGSEPMAIHALKRMKEKALKMGDDWKKGNVDILSSMVGKEWQLDQLNNQDTLLILEMLQLSVTSLSASLGIANPYLKDLALALEPLEEGPSNFILNSEKKDALHLLFGLLIQWKAVHEIFTDYVLKANEISAKINRNCGIHSLTIEQAAAQLEGLKTKLKNKLTSSAKK